MQIAIWGQALLRCALDLLAPERCAACESLEPSQSGFCDSCGEPQALLDVACHVEGVPVFAGVRYGEPMVSAIHRFKYGAAPELCRPLAAWSVRGIDLLGVEASDVWVPVPLHPLRLAERGYNQSTLVARELARVAHGTVDPRRLQRIVHTAQQAKRDRNEREQNVSAAFAARPRACRARVVLVDDVVTSGATLAACIRVLHAAGDRVVGCVAVAHAATSAA